MSEFLLQNAQRLHQAGNLKEAARLYGEALKLNPRQFEALYALGYLHFQSAQFGEAERLIGEAVQVNPRSAEAHFIRGCALQRLNRNEDALDSFDRAVANKPDFVEALINRGAAHMALKHNAEALKDFDALIAVNPANAGAWNNRGCILQNMNRYEEALSCFEKASSLSPDFVAAFVNQAAALAALKRYEEAASAYEKVLGINPEMGYVRGNLLLYRLQCCDWRTLGKDRDRIAKDVRAGKRVIQPFIFVTLSDSLADQLQCARIAISHEWPPSPTPLWRGERYRHEKTRVAYISADFREHAVARLVAGLFEHHDKSRFETVAVSLVKDDGSEMRARIRGAFDRFIDAESKTDGEVAEQLRQMEIDVAVDLMGFTAGCRPGILSVRPAPVQANFLGYPGTMGASYVDYIVADRIVLPDEHRPYYTENVVTLPDTYQCNDSRRRISERTPSRADAGLPKRGFIFCCFNNCNKITPDIFDVWMRLLRAVEGSVLWLLESNQEATRNLRREAGERSVDGNRLIFAPRMELADHLARHRLADLFLDTLPYGAHTTTSDALWAGLPVLTCMGSTFAGRVAASLLHAADVTELITNSLGAYEALALNLARDESALKIIRTKLAANRDRKPLFDTARFTRHFESALTTMLERQHRGEPPAHFAVDPISS